VQILWTMRHEKIFSAQRLGKCVPYRMCMRFRAALRLNAPPRRVQFARFHFQLSRLDTVAAALHHFEESIAGHHYLIEVAAVDENRWRAHIVRTPGVPTALMPFYGRTPVEAAQLLCSWLTRAHAKAAPPV